MRVRQRRLGEIEARASVLQGYYAHEAHPRSGLHDYHQVVRRRVMWSAHGLEGPYRNDDDPWQRCNYEFLTWAETVIVSPVTGCTMGAQKCSIFKFVWLVTEFEPVLAQINSHCTPSRLPPDPSTVSDTMLEFVVFFFESKVFFLKLHLFR